MRLPSGYTIERGEVDREEVTTTEAADICRLRKENAEPRRANETAGVLAATTGS